MYETVYTSYPLKNPVPQTLLDKNIKAARKVLDGYPAIHYATLFGSVVKHRLTHESDIDLAIAADKPLETEDKLRLIGELNLCLTHPVDLVDLNRVSGPILQQALCTGVVIKKTSTEKLAELIKRMWYNQADMMPNSLMILEKHCQRFING